MISDFSILPLPPFPPQPPCGHVDALAPAHLAPGASVKSDSFRSFPSSGSLPHAGAGRDEGGAHGSLQIEVGEFAISLLCSPFGPHQVLEIENPLDKPPLKCSLILMKVLSELAKDALELPPLQRLTLARIL